MTATTVRVLTVDKDNLSQGGNECKFYRSFSLDVFTVFQFGSQRNGKSGGTFKVVNRGNIARATAASIKQVESKESEGYSNRETHAFQVDLDKFTEVMGKQGDKGAGAWLENMFAAARSSNAVYTPPSLPGVGAPAHKHKASPAVTSSTPDTPKRWGTPGTSLPVDQLQMLTQRALSAISLAATDPAKALTEYSLVTEEVDKVEVTFRKVRSYLNTLETLIEDVL